MNPEFLVSCKKVILHKWLKLNFGSLRHLVNGKD